MTAPQTREVPEQQAAPSQTTAVRVEGNPEAGRTLTLRFPKLVEDLLSLPDPGTGTIRHYGPGIDLLHALRAESADFGSASPATPANASIADQLLGLTDEAFDRAEEILLATDEEAVYHNQTDPDPGLSLLLMELGGLSIRYDAVQLGRLPAAADTRIGGEFY